MILRGNGTGKPDEFGTPSRMIWVESGDRRLQASIVAAPYTCEDKVAVLLFHGSGETISDWAKTQAFLSRQCVASMIFDYSGHGSSTPPAHVSTLNADALAAYAAFLQQFPDPEHRCILGHSMGVAPMLDGYSSFHPAPDCVVVANGFSSLEDMMRDAGAPALLAALLHGTWNNVRAIRTVDRPLLVVHSDLDHVITLDIARRLDAAAPASALHMTFHGFDHNALYVKPDLAWWAPVLAFLHSSRKSGEP